MEELQPSENKETLKKDQLEEGTKETIFIHEEVETKSSMRMHQEKLYGVTEVIGEEVIEGIIEEIIEEITEEITEEVVNTVVATVATEAA